VPMVGSLIEANTVCAGCRAYSARLLIGVQLKVADEVVGVVVEVREVFGRGLL
jgi:hypothetical protein